MMVLYDEEEIMRSYIESEVYEAVHEARIEERQEATYEANIKTAKCMLIDGELSLDRIAKFSNLPIEVVKELASEL